ncbi:MAG TPA: serine/threonine protein kinase [Elusimicrobia bacterium]|nr:serine/threonine protein kinase [Elusimicrobiota bacterium]
MGAAALVLEVLCGGKPLRSFSFAAADVFILGRSGECHCSLPDDPYLSASHFLIEIAPPRCFLRDLGSRNGTFVNGARCGSRRPDETAEEAAKRAETVELKDGDSVLAGTAEVRVHLSPPEPPEPPPPARPTPGSRRIGEYELAGELGRGSMGLVYLARRPEDGKPAALKVMSVMDSHLSRKQRECFQREVESTKSLRHPNVVAFYGSGCSGDDLWFAMEYCDGGSLSALMKRCGGRLPLEQAAPLMLQVLSGLEYAHQLNIVHRDLKPDNILLVRRAGGFDAKISDFGLAKNFLQAGLSGISTPDSGGGTLGFMPKEQLLNFMYAKPASDVFSVGATFYTLLTGSYVYDFEGGDPFRAVLEGRTVALSRRGPGLPERLAAVLDQAVAVEPERRFPSAAEMRRALAEALT